MSSPRHVLVADDDASLGPLIVRVVRGLYPATDVTLVSNGLDALQVFDRRGAELVITNQEMPGLDGLALIAELRRRSIVLPILMATASTQIAPQALTAGASAVLLKPFTVAALRLALTQLLRP